MSWSTSLKTILGMSSKAPSETRSAGPSARPSAGPSARSLTGTSTGTPKSKAPSWFQPFLDRPHDEFDRVKYFNLVLSCISAYRNIRAVMRWVHDEQENTDRYIKRWFLKCWEYAGMIPSKRKRDRPPHKDDATLKCFDHLSKPWDWQSSFQNHMNRPPTPEPETSKQAVQHPVPRFAGRSRPQTMDAPEPLHKGKTKADKAADGDIRMYTSSSLGDKVHLHPRKHYPPKAEDTDLRPLR